MDLVVTVPKQLWAEWICEGDPVGADPTGIEWGFYVGPRKPPIEPGERLYIVAHGRVRGYAPVTTVACIDGQWAIGREGGAVACTIEHDVIGFRGFRRRWWEIDDERPYPDWDIDGVPPGQLAELLPRINWSSWEDVFEAAAAGHSAAIAAIEADEQGHAILEAGRNPIIRDTVPFVAERLQVTPKQAEVFVCWASSQVPTWNAGSQALESSQLGAG